MAPLLALDIPDDETALDELVDIVSGLVRKGLIALDGDTIALTPLGLSVIEQGPLS